MNIFISFSKILQNQPEVNQKLEIMMSDTESYSELPTMDTVSAPRHSLAANKPFPMKRRPEPLKLLQLGAVLEPDDVNRLLSKMGDTWNYNNNFNGFQIRRHIVKDRVFYIVDKNLETNEKFNKTVKIDDISITSI